MTDDNAKSEIIDIDPENIVERKAKAPDQAAPQPRTKFAKVFGMGFSAILISGIAGGWVYRDFLSSYFPSDQVQTMQARVDALETASKAFGSKLDAVVGVTDEIKAQLGAAQAAADEANKLASGLKTESAATKTSLVAMQSNLSKAIGSIDELRAKIIVGGSTSPMAPDASGLAPRVASLEKDVASLKQSRVTGKADTAQLSQSLADIKAKISAGASYQAEFDRIQRLVPVADGLDVLANSAAQGLPNAQELATELKSIVAQLPKAADGIHVEDKGWWGTATDLLSSVITIKTVAPSDWRGVAAESLTLAEQGDLFKAVDGLEKTEGALPIELRKWHDKAVARIALEAALDKTAGAVLRQIAAKG